MNFLNDIGLERLWAHILLRLSPKVDKIEGKQLSTEDFTTEEKEKLAAIQAGAEVNIQPDWNQEDENQKDFIKNKPELSAVATTGSYQDLKYKPFGENVAVLPQTSFTYSEDFGHFISDQFIDLKAGEEYTVIINGEEYIEKANVASGENPETGEPMELGVMLGDENSSYMILALFPQTSELVGGIKTALLCLLEEIPESMNVEIIQKVKKIEGKFLTGFQTSKLLEGSHIFKNPEISGWDKFVIDEVPSFSLDYNEKCFIFINGREFYCPAITATYAGETLYGFGSVGEIEDLAGFGLPVTDDPFAFAFAPSSTPNKFSALIYFKSDSFGSGVDFTITRSIKDELVFENKYLRDVYWEDIKNIPFGKSKKEIIVPGLRGFTFDDGEGFAIVLASKTPDDIKVGSIYSFTFNGLLGDIKYKAVQQGPNIYLTPEDENITSIGAICAKNNSGIFYIFFTFSEPYASIIRPDESITSVFVTGYELVDEKIKPEYLEFFSPKVIAPRDVYTPSYGGDDWSRNFTFPVSSNFNLEAGDRCIVSWNGKKYPCIAYRLDPYIGSLIGNNSGHLFLGNAGMGGWSNTFLDTKEPFSIAFLKQEDGSILGSVSYEFPNSTIEDVDFEITRDFSTEYGINSRFSDNEYWETLKNKPFGEEKKYIVEPIEVELLGDSANYTGFIEKKFVSAAFEVGKQYIVEWDGLKTIATYHFKEDSAEMVLDIEYFGLFSIYDYLISTEKLIVSSPTAGKHIISIYELVEKKIDSKYLPEITVKVENIEGLQDYINETILGGEW